MPSPFRDTRLIAIEGELFMNISYYQESVVLELRRFTEGSWELDYEVSLPLRQWSRFAQAICGYDIELEFFLERNDVPEED